MSGSGQAAGADLHVEVSGIEFAEALSGWRTFRPNQLASEARIYLGPDGLVIDCAGNSVSMTVTGQWERVVRVSTGFILGLSRKPPSDETILVRVEGGRLHVGGTSIECTLGGHEDTQIELPIGAGLVKLLKIGLTRTAGLQRDIAAAEQEAVELLDAAIIPLSKLGVTRAQLDAFVRQSLIAEPGS